MEGLGERDGRGIGACGRPLEVDERAAAPAVVVAAATTAAAAAETHGAGGARSAS